MKCVEVVKGAEGDLLEGFFSIFLTLKLVFLHSFKNLSDSSWLLNLVFNSAVNFSLFKEKMAVVLNEDSGLNILISFSLSTTNFTATD